MGRTSLSSRRLARDLRIWIREVSPVPSAVPAGEEEEVEEEEVEEEEEEEEGPEAPESPPSSASSVGGFSSVASSPSPQSTEFPSTVLASSTAPPPALGPAASSTTAGIVTLTAIPHTPTFPSSTPTPSSLITSVTSVLAAPPAPSITSASSSESQPLPTIASSQTTSNSAETTAPSSAAQEQNAVQKIDSDNGGSPGKGIHVVLPVLASVAVLGALIFFFLRWRKHRKRSEAERIAALPGPNGGSVSSFPPDYPPPRLDGKTNTKIMDELMSAAYAAENGGSRGTSAYGPNGYLIDEKFTPIPEPEPVTLRGLRHSIARFFRGQYPPKVPAAFRTNSTNMQPPPVPAVPDAFKYGPNAPQLVESQMEPHPGTRIKTFWSDASQRDTMGSAGQNGTLLSLYATESHGLGYFHKERQESGRNLIPAPPTVRVPSGAPSAAELDTPSDESTWRTWGVSQQPKTPTRNWVEKCIRAGGLR